MMEKYLRKLYYDSPAAYTGINNLMRQIKLDGMKIKRSELKEWLKSQDAYTIHKPVRKRFPFRKVFVWTVDSLWQCDLVDMQKYKFKGYNYILTIIDVFSKYAWAIKLKHKTGSEVKDAFLLAFKNRVPNKIQFDEGKEFYNKDIKQLLDKFKIHYYSTKSDKKASVVERFNRTLKTRMWKYFTANETRNWVDILDDLVDNYNNTFHTSIQMTPIEGSQLENSAKVFENLYGDILNESFESKFKIGDLVRISKYKTIFKKGYEPNYTEEMFVVKEVIYGVPTVYKLEDFQKEDIDGIFYEQELSAVNKKDVWKVEKILKRKGDKVLIKWKGWPSKFNSWEPKSNIVK